MRKILAISALLLLLPAPVIAKPAKIKGKLTEPDYQILATDSSGSSVASKKQKFKLRVNFNSGTISLVDSGGSVAGPVVLAYRNAAGKFFTYSQALTAGICGQSGTTAVTGFRIRGKQKRRSLVLGSVTVDNSSGFAYASKKPKKKLLLTGASSSVDENCIPAGAGGRLGLTTAAAGSGIARLAALANDDSDGDGLLNSKDPDDDNDGAADQFDVDRNGDGILDFYQKDPFGNFIGDDGDDEDDEGDDGSDIDDDEDDDFDPFFTFIFSNLNVFIDDTLNLHTGNFEQSEIDEFVREHLTMVVGVPGRGNAGGDEDGPVDFPVHIDCNGLPYCSTGGTGTIADFGGSLVGAKFPEDFDDEGNGQGRIDEVAALNPIGDFFLRPNATAQEIRPGNVITQLFTPRKRLIKKPLMLEFVFNTVPALKSLKPGESNPTTTVINYPVDANGPGTQNNCFQHDTSNGQKVEFTVYRPQRPGIQAAGEAPYMDMGNLLIVVSADHENGGISFCPASAFSSNDPDLVPFTGDPDGGDPNPELGLRDIKGDVPFSSESENTFTFSLDLQECTGQLTGRTQLGIKLRTPRNDNSSLNFCIDRN